MNITNGTVEYERVVRPADFESKRAKVVLSFAVEDGADPAEATAKVMQMAVAEAHRTLGLAPARTEHLTAQPGKPRKQKTAEAAGITDPVFNPVKEAAKVASDPAEIPAPEEDPAVSDAPVVYTDKDIHTAVQKAIAEHGVTASEIKTLTAEFTGVPGKSMTTIDADRRAGFITRVKALHKR